MADRREYSGRRNGSLYRTGSYYQRENTLRKSRSILPYQIFVCAVLLLCLLGGWLLDAQWFADGKRQLLVQINAEDQTQQVGNMLSGILKKDGLENRTPATTSDAASLAPEEEKAQQADVSQEKLEELYRYIEQYGKSSQEEQTASDSLAGMGGYLPVNAISAANLALAGVTSHIPGVFRQIPATRASKARGIPVRLKAAARKRSQTAALIPNPSTNIQYQSASSARFISG